MADPTNRLAMFSAPVADDQVNMLAPQLPPGHPSNMLMWLRDQIPENRDLPPPQFPFDPRSMSMLNAVRGGLETSANWLRGTHDPNAVRIGEDTIAPLGLFGMAGLAGRGAAASRVMADNAKGSVPGTVANSLADSEMPAHLKKMQRQNEYADAKLRRAEEKKAAWAARRGEVYPAPPPLPDSRAGHLMAGPNGIYVNDGSAGWRVTDMPSVESARYGVQPAADIGVKFPGAGRPANDLFADNATASFPGLAANATQEDSPVLDILSKYGLY